MKSQEVISNIEKINMTDKLVKSVKQKFTDEENNALVEVAYITREELEAVVQHFIDKITSSQVNIEPEVAEFVNDKFWELL